MRKHNPQSHGNHVCHVCTRIMEDNFDDEKLNETSSPSTTQSARSSISSSSSSRYALSDLHSYKADLSSSAASISDFAFSSEDIPDEPLELEYPEKLADIEYMAEKMEYRHKQDKKKNFLMTQRTLQPSGKNFGKDEMTKVPQKQKTIPKVTKSCKHNLTKKHKSCDVCYECKSCKDIFLKKSKKPIISRSDESENSNCTVCGELKVKPVRKFVDCIVE